MLDDTWKSIKTAPKNGRIIKLGWVINGSLQYEKTSRWRFGEWEGHWTPTHWQSV